MKAVGGRHLCLLLIAAVVAACSCGRSPFTSTSTAAGLSHDDVKVQVSRVGFDHETGSHYVLLLDETESRELPIMIGENEAQAIMLALRGIKPERPFTHDLIRSIIGKTGNRVDRIVIADMRDEIYYATISMDGGRYSIDSRPSDAIALAMGMNAPIYVNSKLFGSAPTPGLGGGGKIPAIARALGLTVEQLTPDLASYFGQSAGRGVLVSGVSSSAKKAGVARGDIVVKVGDREVRALDDFSRQAAQLKSGGAVTLTLNRGGSNRTVTLESSPAADAPKP
ncbi:bifunctional nuclease domain-containing protein [Candidatus Binatus soli]|jgi:hypothetical protein|uniref:bifunctional nuclease family protein n=1 Tax=Candidatus Binatus soli TaxID=1953413 RepID=UPI003D0EF167